jgi:hypothetical protein
MSGVYLSEETSQMLDYHTLWALAKAQHEERLRDAAAERRGRELPQGPSALRASLSRWLHALANFIEPSTRPLAGVEPTPEPTR